MKHSLALQFKGKAKSKKAGEDSSQEVYSAIASTPALDRYNEVLLPLGMEYEAFMANPVMLNLHEHRSAPVGKVLSISVSKEAVEFDFVFADSENGNELKKLFDTGFMNAFSVGLYPKAYKFIDEDTPDQIEVEVADGKKQKIDLSKYKERPQYVVHQWELLEISPVSVPANPEALLKREAARMMSKAFDGESDSALKSIYEGRVENELAKVLHTLRRFESTDLTSSLSVVPVHNCGITDIDWSADDAMTELAVLCSKNGNGEKEGMDWAEFSKSFAWIDVKRSDELSGYEYLHHSYSDEDDCIVANVHGLRVAMSQLLKDKREESKSAEDLLGIYNHLKKHYDTAGVDCPEYKEYTDEELEVIASGKAAPVEDEAEEADESDESEGSSEGTENSIDVSSLEAKISGIEEQIKELSLSLGIKLGIQLEMIGYLKSQLAGLTIKKPDAQEDDDSEGSDSNDTEEAEFSKSFDSFMESLDKVTE